MILDLYSFRVSSLLLRVPAMYGVPYLFDREQLDYVAAGALVVPFVYVFAFCILHQ